MSRSGAPHERAPQRIREVVEIFNAGDGERYLARYADDAAIHGLPAELEPTKAGLSQFVGAVAAAFPDIQFTVEDLPVRGILIFVLMAVLTLGGCGGTDDTTEDADRNCIITFAGNELCGESGKAWCERFADEVTADAETRSACASVGANLNAGADLSEEDKSVFGDVPELSSELDEEFPDLQPTATYEDGTLDVLLGSEHTSRVSKRQLSKLCDIVGEYYMLEDREPPETTISDVNRATPHTCKFSG